MSKIIFRGKPDFNKRGYYLHSCWNFNWPFAVKSWRQKDFSGMFNFLRHLNINLVLLNPMVEVIPPGITEEELEYLNFYKETINNAKRAGLESWIHFSANLTSTDDIRKLPLAERHFYPFMKKYRLDADAQRNEFLAHMKNILKILNNADGYVSIDGDPGGYPDAQADDYVNFFYSIRQILEEVGKNPSAQKVIPWIWFGWGAESENGWGADINTLTRNVLDSFKENFPSWPFEFIAGRSHLDNSSLEENGWANGRVNIDLMDRAGLIDKSVLMTYEIIEFEPTKPAFKMQFDLIRNVLRTEAKYKEQARGIMGNAQQPIMSLHNLFFFACSTWDLKYLEKSDEEVLRDFADFLGGPADLLVPAWQCTLKDSLALPADLPARLRDSELKSEAASCIPGGSHKYISILADFVDLRLEILKTINSTPLSNNDAAKILSSSVFAMKNWWDLHRYVSTGKNKNFSLSLTHSLISYPLKEWLGKYGSDEMFASTAEILEENKILDRDEIASITDSLKKLILLPEPRVYR